MGKLILNAQDWNDNTPLHEASSRGYGEVITILLAANNIDPTNYK